MFSSGAKYIGQWADDMTNGSGTMIYPNRDRYDGNWINGLKCGQGKYTHVDSSVYEGSWNNDDKNGEGVMTYANGDTYQGEYKLKHLFIFTKPLSKGSILYRSKNFI